MRMSEVNAKMTLRMAKVKRGENDSSIWDSKETKTGRLIPKRYYQKSVRSSRKRFREARLAVYRIEIRICKQHIALILTSIVNRGEVSW